MVGYRPTQIRKPADETEFEKNCVVLFKELLNDPNVSRVGTRGQGQDGVDIKGHRDRDPNQLVGIQCKLKVGNSKLTKREVDEEVKKALTFNPPLNEYFIVTTSKNDTKLQQRALGHLEKPRNPERVLIHLPLLICAEAGNARTGGVLGH
ncbi:restriction endonuclease [Kumtagia ephedrae]|uniref:Uncharacterized protein n=1 Tax=Kumtagia ephedrae TaxID=2116701 RepID=A0A2P7S140_9HYPH|nr:restriction endonuclease [Mesorhizobium ephedrae]PSJ56188.1 hypothetical protein C7I84_21760 [Mesorhizobium ephedrae]